MSPGRSIVALGAVAYDSIETQQGGADDAPGGPTRYFGLGGRYPAFISRLTDSQRAQSIAQADHFLYTFAREELITSLLRNLERQNGAPPPFMICVKLL